MTMMDNMLAYSEVYEILNLLENEYRKRIPQKIIDFFEEERIKEYKPEIKVNVPLTEQNLKRETLVLLAILNINYWCDTEEEKQEFVNELAENEKKKKELKQKYNPDNLFKNKKKEKEEIVIEQINNVDMIVYKESNIFTKLRKWFRKLFFKKK